MKRQSRLPYDHIVWQIIWQIPAGRVLTYGQIAAMIPAPEGMDVPSYERIAPRWVGYAMRRCMSDDANNPRDPAQPSIPWHRVINSQGRISLPEGSYDAAQQQTRLEDEGVEFDRHDRVDFRRFGWDGPADDWLRANNLLRPYAIRRPDDTD
jgi:methylated-DNA-protein-cysteine methyltransferase-like protein